MKKVLLAALAAVGILIGTAVPSTAATSGLCWVNGDTTARLSASKWIIGYDSLGNARYRYHLDLNSGTGVMHAHTLFFRGVAQPSWNDVYIDSWNSPSTVTGKWYRNIDGDSVQYYQCSVTL